MRRKFLAQCLGTAVLLAPFAPTDAAAQDISAADRTLTDAYNASAQELYAQFAASSGNIVFSPYSIGTAMAMVLAGARGETQREMAQVLKQSLPVEQINAANSDVLRLLNGYDHSADPPTCPKGLRLNGTQCQGRLSADSYCPSSGESVGDTCVAPPLRKPSAKLLAANALMLADANVATDYATLLKDQYAAEIFEKATLADINGWVSRKTEGKIDKILDQLSDLTLVNAIYFKAHWASVFDVRGTKPDVFHLTALTQANVPTMQKRDYYSVVAGGGYRAIRLPYEVPALGMVIVVPDEVEGLSAVTRKLDFAELSRTFGALHSQPVQYVALALPRFKSAFRADLKSAFKQAGMRLAFARGNADFSGMTGQPASLVPTAIDQIVHRAVIDVMEGGTEAAAATAVGIRVTSLPPEPLQFRVDRPFLYYIVDDASGAILFEGRVTDPR